MSKRVQGVSTMVLGAVMAIAVLHAEVQAQMGPNPYRPADGLQAGSGPGLIGEGWAKLPYGRAMGSPGGIEVDVDGESIWAIVRCGNDGTPRGSQTYCDSSDLDPIIKFGPDGNVVTMFGSRMFAWPHGLHVDRDGNVWVTGSGKRRITAGTRFRTSGLRVFPAGRAPHDPGRGGGSGGWTLSPHLTQRRRHRPQWRYLRCGRSQPEWQQPDRPVFERRGRSSRTSGKPGTAPVSSTARTPLPWTQMEGSSSPTGRICGSSSSTRKATT